MPSYTFRCGQGCTDFAQQHPIASPPDGTSCPHCGAWARRMIGAPALSVGRGAAMRLHDSTRASADAPEVVTSIPPAKRPAKRVTSNPLHRRLPRP